MRVVKCDRDGLNDFDTSLAISFFNLRNFSVNASPVTTAMTRLYQLTVCFQVPTLADVPNQKNFHSRTAVMKSKLSVGNSFG